MYVLNRDAFRSVNKNHVVRFVECWERYYDDAGYDKRKYFPELNIGRSLSEQNISRLLRWKDPRLLTHPAKADGKANPRVIRVLEQIGAINGFGDRGLTTDEFQGVTQKICIERCH